MEKKINPVLKRLSDFAESQGGFAEVGRRIQKHPSMFYNLVRRDALPSLATLSEIAFAFPELDLNFVIRGEQKELDGIEGELEEIKKKLQRSEGIIDKLVGKTKGEVKSSGCTGEASAFIIKNGKRRFLLSPGLTHRTYTRF